VGGGGVAHPPIVRGSSLPQGLGNPVVVSRDGIHRASGG
jgi:hypothetical protein